MATKHKLSDSVRRSVVGAGALKYYNMHSGRVQVVKGKFKHWMTLCEDGTPDGLAFFMTVAGTVLPVYIEIKDKADQLRPTQVDRFIELVDLGFKVIVCSAEEDTSPKALRVREAGVIWAVGASALYDILVALIGRQTAMDI